MPNQREMLFLRPSGVLDNIFELLMIPSSRTFDKDCDGKLKPEELLGILTWDNSKLPEGLQEVIEEFQDSDGLILYEGTLNSEQHVCKTHIFNLFEGLARFLADGGIAEAKDA